METASSEAKKIGASTDCKGDLNSKVDNDLALNDALNEFICPITLQVPIDPVLASDGRIYERAAIEAHIQSCCRGNMFMLRSPITNEPMGSTLSSAIQVRNAIEIIVRSGAIVDESKAEKWIEKMKDEKEFERVKAKANKGDDDAMYQIGRWYAKGQKGVIKDLSRAFYWFQKSADCENIRAMAETGICRVQGRGCKRNEVEGMYFLTAAAMGGSDVASYYVGLAYALGDHGLPSNTQRAGKWLAKVVDGTCQVRHLCEEDIDYARTIMQELQGEPTSCQTAISEWQNEF